MVIPKSASAERVAENGAVFGFELSSTELDALDALGSAGDAGRLCWRGDPLRMLDFA